MKIYSEAFRALCFHGVVLRLQTIKQTRKSEVWNP